MSNEKIKEAALELLLHNRKVGFSKWANKEYNFSCPSPLNYSYQWFWDSCFHGITLSHLDPKLAKKEISSLVSMQQPDGFIPHVIFWKWDFFAMEKRLWHFTQSMKWTFKPRFTGMIQPPVLAITIEKIYEATQDKEFLQALLPKAEKYYEWLRENRDPDGDNLISIITPYESGLDYAPHFDKIVNFYSRTLHMLQLKYRIVEFKNKLMGYNSKKILKKDWFDVEDVMVNSIYADALKSIARLWEILNETEKAKRFRRRAIAVANAIMEKCFDEKDGLFYSLSGKNEEKLKTNTIVSLFPIMLDEIDKDALNRLIEEHLLNKKEFWLPYPLPSVPQSEPTFNPNKMHYIWRGPSWLNTNWFIVRGLRKHGHNDIADHITSQSKAMIEKYGFWEYYNPFTGEGYGANSFGWSTLIVDMLEN